MRSDAVGRVVLLGLTLLIVSCFSTAPVQASCKHGWPDETCGTLKKKKSAKVATRKPAASYKYVAKEAAPRPQRNARSAQAACCKEPYTKVHGWVGRRNGVALYHDGQRYAGGTRHGPALWYNNYEGGFNAAVFWKLSDRQGP